MRGQAKAQPEFLTLMSPESVVPKDHPLRPIKAQVDEVLKAMDRDFEAMYAAENLFEKELSIGFWKKAS